MLVDERISRATIDDALIGLEEGVVLGTSHVFLQLLRSTECVWEMRDCHACSDFKSLNFLFQFFFPFLCLHVTLCSFMFSQQEALNDAR